MFEEHLLTSNVTLDKTLEMDQPLWIICLDLSKAFDWVSWGSLWQAAGGHGVTQHLVWILQLVVINNVGQLLGQWKTASSLTLPRATRVCSRPTFVLFSH